MVDWCLEEEFIRLENRDGYPLLVYAERGLAIDIELAAREFLVASRKGLPPHAISSRKGVPPHAIFSRKGLRPTRFFIRSYCG